MTHVTVGFSGSGASRRALRWALRDAAATGRPVHVVTVDPGGSGPETVPPSRALAETLPGELHRLADRRPTVTTASPVGGTVAELLLAAAGSSALVVGCGRKVGPVGPGRGRVLRDLVRRVPVPLVLVGPQAVLTVTRRLLVLSDDDDVTAGWALAAATTRGADLGLLTAWGGWPEVPADRAGARTRAGQRHERAAVVLARGRRRPLRAEIAEGATHDVVATRVRVGDLVVVGAGEVDDVPLRTARAPVVVLPARDRTVVLPDTGQRGGQRGGAEGRRAPAGTQVSMSTGRESGATTT